MNFFTFLRRRLQPKTNRPAVPTRRPQLEELEPRVVPYATAGNAWPNPESVTISFEPDGTNLGGVSSDLFAQFNAAFGSTAAWENVILRAAQTWAAQTNLNLTVVLDNGADSGSGSYQQGDPGFGDIRIGGFDMQGSNALALGYMPPPVNNFSIAGDIAFNTGQIFNINGLDYDLYTVALHEFGHAFGLDHSATTAAIMYPTYQNAENGLFADDVAGIRAIYSQGAARSPDAFDAAGSNGSFAAASDVTSSIDPSTDTALLTDLDVTTTSDLDYYKFTVPSGAGSTAQIRIQSQGLSLLAPSLRVYNSAQTLVASTIGTGDYGANLTVNLNNVTAGQVYYIRVGAATTSVFGVGSYALGLNLAGGTAPTESSPDTTLDNGDPLNGGGGIADRKDSAGVSVNLLLGQTLGGAQQSVGSLGLGFLNPVISGVGGLLSPLGGQGGTAGVDFADLMVANQRPDAAPAGANLAHLPPTSTNVPFSSFDVSALSLLPQVAPAATNLPVATLPLSNLSYIPSAPITLSANLMVVTPITGHSQPLDDTPSPAPQPERPSVDSGTLNDGQVDSGTELPDANSNPLPAAATDHAVSSENLPWADLLERSTASDESEQQTDPANVGDLDRIRQVAAE